MKTATVPLTVPPLAEWLGQLREFGARLVATGRVITVHGRPMTDTDRQVIARHRHALLVATAGTHPEWWAYVAGRTDHPPEPDEIPVADDDPDAFACACCGAPAAHLDPELLPWCDDHHVEEQPA